MIKYKNAILITLMLLFMLFSFYPTIYEISQSSKLKQKNREFILEHNYYWPDYNLYLSKVRQGYENRWLAVEKYTSETHKGSLIQIFYLYLGKLGSLLNLNPNYAYQLGRIILSPLLMLVILSLITLYFRASLWQIIAFIFTLVSGSFPHVSFSNGQLQLSRYMEWWSNIDALQRITFIPHILFGQVISFYLLFNLTRAPFEELKGVPLTKTKLAFYILLANLTGLVFPPSLITLDGVLILLVIIKMFKKLKIRNSLKIKNLKLIIRENHLLFVIFTLPSIFYLLITTKFIPWSALVDFHRTHPMMIPLDQYVLGTGPIIILGFFGGILAICNKQKKYYPLILWVVITFLFASIFSIIKEQSPLRFTQTGLFIPLGILGTYLFKQLWHICLPRRALAKWGYWLLVIGYLIINLAMMQNSLKWQLNFMNQRIAADYPAVPYPPQTMYPLAEWMDGINWLRDNTKREDIVLAEITAGNFIPAYSGNFVYFGQSNTVDYDRKLSEVDRFFRGQMSSSQAEIFLKTNRIKYIFIGPQESEKLGAKKLIEIYPYLKQIYSNNQTTIYSFI